MKKRLMLGLMIGMFMVFSFASVSASLTDDLVAFWDLDNNDLTDQHSSYDLTNSGTTNSTGILGSGRNFDGSNDYLVNAMSKSFGTTASVSFWMEWDDVGSDPVQFVIEAEAGSKMMVHTGGGSGTNGLRWTYNDDGTSMDNTGIISSGWHHYVVVYNGTHSIIYKDGSEFDSESHSYSSLSITQFNIGRRASNIYFLDGRLDEIGIWDRVLTPTEVSTLYNSGSALAYPFTTNNAPSININNPTDEEIFASTKVTISANITDDSKISNVTFFINNSQVYFNNSEINGTYSFDYYGDNGYYELKIMAIDNESQVTNSTPVQFRINSTQDIELLTPEDNNAVAGLEALLNVSFLSSDSERLWKNATFYVWDESGLFYNETKTLSLANETSFVNVSGLSQLKAYDWNVYACYGNASYTNCEWSNNGNFTFYTYITLNVLDYLGGHLSSINIDCSSIGLDMDITSPYKTSLSTFTSLDSENISCTFTDLQNYNKQNTTIIEFSKNKLEYNVTLAQKELKIYFYHYNGSLATVTGYFSDGNYTENFTNSSFVSILQNMMLGQVRVLFGFNETVMNYTQYYEYDNDWVTHTEENITILENVDTSAYIKVIDEGGNPIDDVLVRVAYSLPTEGGTYKEMGQRFTGSDGNTGFTSFFFDSLSDVSIRFTKDGYSAKTIVTDIGANTYTYSDPLTIVLERDETNVYHGVAVRTYTWYNNNMSKIPLSIYAPSRTLAKYTTNYRTSLGLGNATITLDEFKKGKINLTRGTDFCSNCLTDLTITIYIDNSLWGTITIPYQETTTDKFNEPTGLDTETKARMGWIFLIALVSVLGILIKGSDESLGSGGKGKSLFMIGALILGILFPEDFTFLLVVVVLYGIMLYLRRFVGE